MILSVIGSVCDDDGIDIGVGLELCIVFWLEKE